MGIGDWANLGLACIATFLSATGLIFRLQLPVKSNQFRLFGTRPWTKPKYKYINAGLRIQLTFLSVSGILQTFKVNQLWQSILLYGGFTILVGSAVLQQRYDSRSQQNTPQQN